MNEPQNMTRRDIRRIFRANRGAAARLARELGVLQGTISLWLSGKVKSQRITDAAYLRAIELSAKTPALHNRSVA